MKEIWKTIVGYENYQVSNLGRVRSLRHNNIYYLNPMRRGYDGQKYECVRLSNEHGYKNFSVHRLVASYFIPNPNNYPIINCCNQYNKDGSPKIGYGYIWKWKE